MDSRNQKYDHNPFLFWTSIVVYIVEEIREFKAWVCFYTYSCVYIATIPNIPCRKTWEHSKRSYLLTFFLSYLLTPWSRVLLKKPTGSQPVGKFPHFIEPRRFITVFTIARHLSLFWVRSPQSIVPRSTSWRSILILSFHLPLNLPSGLSPSGFLNKTLYAHFPHTCYIICPFHSSRFVHPNNVSNIALSSSSNGECSSLFMEILCVN